MDGKSGQKGVSAVGLLFSNRLLAPVSDNAVLPAAVNVRDGELLHPALRDQYQ